MKAKMKGTCHGYGIELKRAVRKWLRNQHEVFYRRWLLDLGQRSTTATTRQKELIGGYQC